MEEKVYAGEVIFFNKSYGFISWEIDGNKQDDLFAHHTDINAKGFRTLKKGQKVTFSVGENRSGQPKAINIIVTE